MSNLKSGLSITPALNQDVEHNAVLVDGAPQPVRCPGDLDDNLIEVPLVAGPRQAPPDLGTGGSCAKAAKRLLRKLLKRQARAPRVMITNKLASYPAAKKDLLPAVEHRRHKGLNNRAEDSHQPTRQQERQMKPFTSAKQAQRFLAAGLRRSGISAMPVDVDAV